MKTRAVMHAPKGFVYQLAPYLRKQEWQSDRLEHRMSQLKRQMASLAQSRAAIASQTEEQTAYLHASQQARLNPALHRSGLLHLLELRHQLQRCDNELADLGAQKELLQAEWIAQQRKIDGLMEHRTTMLQAHVAETQRLAAVEADRDWLSRRRPLPLTMALSLEESP